MASCENSEELFVIVQRNPCEFLRRFITVDEPLDFSQSMRDQEVVETIGFTEGIGYEDVEAHCFEMHLAQLASFTF